MICIFSGHVYGAGVVNCGSGSGVTTTSAPSGTHTFGYNCSAVTNYIYVTMTDGTIWGTNCAACTSGFYRILKTNTFSSTCAVKYLDCDTCPVGKYYNSSSQSCLACTNLPTSNAHYTSNGGTSATGCSWECNSGYTKNGNSCTSGSTSTGCAAGTAGTTPACAQCALATKNDDATSAAGQFGLDKSYVPSTIEYKDEKGKYHFTNDCYYTKNGAGDRPNLYPSYFIYF